MAVKYYQIVAVSWTSVHVESQGKQLWVASYTPCSSDNLITGKCLGNFTAHLPQTQESCIVWIDPDIQALISSKVALQTWVTFSRLVSFYPCRGFQATSNKEGRPLSPYLPLGGALKALLWWEGHQLELPLGTCASSEEPCSEAHTAPLRTGPFPCRRSPRARGVWFTGNSSARPDASKLERLWYFIMRGNVTIQEDEMSKGWDLCSAFSRLSVLSVLFQNEHVFRGRESAKFFLFSSAKNIFLKVCIISWAKSKHQITTICFCLK